MPWNDVILFLSCLTGLIWQANNFGLWVPSFVWLTDSR